MDAGAAQRRNTVGADLAARLEALRARLGRQPYDAPALCEELVVLAALRRHGPARAAFEQLLPFLGASEATAVLDDLSSGRVAVHSPSGQAYWLDEPPPPELPVGETRCYSKEPRRVSTDGEAAPNAGHAALVTAAEAFVLEIAEVLAEPPARVVFHIQRARRLAPHAVRVVNGFGLVVLPPEARDDAGSGRPLLAHEIAHTALACGQLFLDEGLATYFERRAEGRDLLAADPDRHLPPLAALLGPDLGRLLCRSPSESYIQRIYDHGARLFAWLLEHRRGARLGPFFLRAVLGHSRGTLPAELERYFEVDLDALEAALLERQA